LCNAPLVNISRLPVCEDCLDAIHLIGGGLCSVCGERLLSPDAVSEPSELLCVLCRRLAPPYVKAAAYGSYEGGLRALIHFLKYEGVRPAAGVLGGMMAKAIEPLQAVLGPAPVRVVPVPLHFAKRRQRGFNQAELIARAAIKLKPLGDFEFAPV